MERARMLGMEQVVAGGTGVPGNGCSGDPNRLWAFAQSVTEVRLSGVGDRFSQNVDIALDSGGLGRLRATRGT